MQDLWFLVACRALSSGPAHITTATLHAGLAAVPAASWLAVVPQLFAALAHCCASQATPPAAGTPGKESQAGPVREAILGILRRVGELAPSEVVLPALIELREPHPGLPLGPLLRRHPLPVLMLFSARYAMLFFLFTPLRASTCFAVRLLVGAARCLIGQRVHVKPLSGHSVGAHIPLWGAVQR